MQVFTKAGVYVRSIGGENEETDARLHGPVGVSVDREHLAVSCCEGDYISIFDKASGRFVRRFGSTGMGHGRFYGPCGLALHGQHMYVADKLNRRVQVLTKEGDFVRTIGSASGQLVGPDDIALDEDFAYVCDANSERVQIFSKDDGAYVREVRQDAGNGFRALRPGCIALHGGGVYIVDENNPRVSVFRGGPAV